MEINQGVQGITSISSVSNSQTEKHSGQLANKNKLSLKLETLIDSNGQTYEAGMLSGYSKEQISKAVEEANRLLVGKNTKLSYKIHEATKRWIVELKDIKTDEVVKEIPPQKLLDVVAEIWKETGIIVDKKG
ncbi:flagellar protein FlaG [Vagococcus sp.]|uniref:flagellar protein FlaG n=1 Tax=Vagococcus sp. TaxID=1933889 RepID=UPI003F97A469